MKKEVKWGILGCGKIARKFASDLRYVKNAKLIAVAARELGTANRFANEFPAKYIYGNYHSLVENPEVDVVYIATPHGLHYEHALLCLNHQKSVLCEKAFAINFREAKEMIELARSKKVFLMEAFWTKFLPHYRKMKTMIAEGKIGTIQSVIANFGFIPTPPIAQRIYDPALGGGALLDIGVYPVFLSLDLLGKPDEVIASMTPSPQGTDSQCAIQFNYNTGAFAQLFCTFKSNLSTSADVAGDKGRIRLTNRFYAPVTEMEYFPDYFDSRKEISFEKCKGNGYEHETQHVTDCLLQGLTESPVLTHSNTLLLMETLDRIRAAAKINYPADKH